MVQKIHYPDSQTVTKQANNKLLKCKISKQSDSKREMLGGTINKQMRKKQKNKKW